MGPTSTQVLKTRRQHHHRTVCGVGSSTLDSSVSSRSPTPSSTSASFPESFVLSATSLSGGHKLLSFLSNVMHSSELALSAAATIALKTELLVFSCWGNDPVRSFAEFGHHVFSRSDGQQLRQPRTALVGLSSRGLRRLFRLKMKKLTKPCKGNRVWATKMMEYMRGSPNSQMCVLRAKIPTKVGHHQVLM